jgi:outer membrane protein assembly factor BamB
MKKLLLLAIPLAVALAWLAWWGWPRRSQTPSIPSAPASSAVWHGFRGDPSLTGMVPDLAVAYQLKWTQKLDSGIEAPPVVTQDLVLVATENGTLSALKRTSGALVWSIAAGEGGIEASPLIVDGKVVVTTLDGEVIAFDLQQGREAWRFSAGEAIHGGANRVHLTDKTLILFGCYDFYLYALDASSGKLAWKIKTENFLNGTPAVDASAEVAVFGGCDNWLRTVDLKTGLEKTKTKADSYLPSSPALFAGSAYMGSHTGSLYAVDIATGQVRWRETIGEGTPLLAPPAIDGDSVAVVSGKQLVIVDAATGRQKGTFGLHGNSSSGALIGSGRVLVGDEAGWLTLASLKDGKILWEYEIGPRILASPVVVGPEIFVCDQTGNVYCFRASR